MRCNKCGKSVLKINLLDSGGCILCTKKSVAKMAKKRGRKKKEDFIIYSINDDRNEIEPEFFPQFEPDNLKPSEISCNIRLNSYSVLPQVFQDDFLFRIGDIVSLRQNNLVYYAQIRILVEDMYCEKYAAIIWLLPTLSGTDFDPNTFTYGPQDEWFYHLRDITFVMHAPTDFYRRFIAPLPKNSKISSVIRCKFSKRKS